MDGVELIMEWEEEFEIEIPDEAASRITTVGEVVDLVHAQLEKREAREDYCRTSRAFYALRRSLCELLDLPRRAIAPKTKLGELIPRQRRRQVWRGLSQAGLSVPSLSIPEQASIWAALIVFTLTGAVWAVTLTRIPALRRAGDNGAFRRGRSQPPVTTGSWI